MLKKSWRHKHVESLESPYILPDTTSSKPHKQPPISKPNPTHKKAKLSTTPEWLFSTPVDLLNDSLDISALSTPDPVAAQIDLSITLSHVVKGKQHAEFNVPDPL